MTAPATTPASRFFPIAGAKLVRSAALALLTTAVVLDVGCASASSEGSATAESQLGAADGGFESDGGDRYAGLEGLRDDALKAALFEIVKNQRPLGYNRAKVAIFQTLLTPTTDIECVYTGRRTAPNGTTAPGNMNTEHSWPQSLGASREPARSDLHHLFPSDARMNSARGNHLFGEVTCLDDVPDGGSSIPCSTESGGSALGKTADGRVAFEVRPQKRGDIARAQFYFSVRYKLPIPTAAEPTLRAWHVEDPVDDEERFRNDAIERQQYNRNPFVDHVEYVDAIADF